VSLSAAALQLLLEKGLSLSDAVELAGVIEAELPKRTSGAERQARYRARLKEDGNGDVTSDVTDDTSPTLSLPSSPQTPQQPTHTRESVTTRGRDEREDAGFARFWAAYPRKTAKADARKAFTKAWRKLPPFDEDEILAGGLERAKAGWVDAQFIPHAATWLNGERWQDEPATIIQMKPRQLHERPHPDAKFTRRQDILATHERGADLAARLHREP
jgi:hypothetical protein